MKIINTLLTLVIGLLLVTAAAAQNRPAPYQYGQNNRQFTRSSYPQQPMGAPKGAGVEPLPLEGTEPKEDKGGMTDGNGNGHDNGNGCGDEEEDKDGCGDNGGCGEEEEEEEEECKCTCYLFGPDEPAVMWDEMWGHCDDCCKPCFTVGGWAQAGYHENPTPLSMARGDLGSFNDVPDNFELHQGWLYVEKALDPKPCCWDWGFRADMMYGTDAQKTQAFGNTIDAAGNPRGWDNDWDHGVYGWALPQAYVQVGTESLRITAGKWYTKHGYEVVPATGNFFFSHTLTFFNSEPFTHTGVIAEYDVCDDLTALSAYTLGWDTGFDSFNGDGHSYMGGFNAQLHDDIAFSYMYMHGNFGARGDDAYAHTVMLTVQLTECLESVTQSDLLRIRNANDGTRLRDDDVGVVQYLFYTYNDCIKYGGRMEWWKNDGVSNYAATYGVNIRPHANMVIRPEYRHDWVPATDFRQDTFACDAIFTF